MDHSSWFADGGNWDEEEVMSSYEKLEVWQNALNWACDIIKEYQ